MHSLSPTVYLIFTAATAAGVLLQAFVLLGIFLAVGRLSAKLQETAEEVKSKALPTIDLARRLLDDVSPNLKIAASNLAEVSEVLRDQANHMNETVESLLKKTNAQINRVDDVVTATFNALNQVSRAIDMAIALPARRMSGILHGVKVGIETLMRGKKHVHPPQSGPAEAVATEEAAAEPPMATASMAVNQKPA